MDQVFNEVSLSASLVDNHSALSALHDLGKASINGSSGFSVGNPCQELAG